MIQVLKPFVSKYCRQYFTRVLTAFLVVSSAARFCAAILFSAVLFFVSCQRELPCFDCLNKPPAAHAGIDQTIFAPQDSVLLNGTLSTDADGTIAQWLWIEISGPSPAVIVQPAAVLTRVNKLAAGRYLFELTVTDDNGAQAKDTVAILVNHTELNQPPAACAGADQTVILPASSVMLWATCSTDPDNNIERYRWSKISGPSMANVLKADSAVTQVNGLVKGVYEFEVKVTDAMGLFSADTIKITVNAAPIAANCGETNRPVITAKLVSFAQLSEPCAGMAVASAGNKIVFAGASVSGNPPNYGSDKVHIFDIVTRTWSTAKLSVSRADVAAISAGNKIFIAGGRLGNLGNYNYFSTVDVYDAVADSWSVTSLSQPRAYIAAASAGNKVLFAGGEQQWPLPVSDRVDIFDLSTNTWSQRALSVPRNGISAVTANNKVFFAGGSNQLGGINNVSGVIDIYDNTLSSWSVSGLAEPKAFFSGIYFGNKIYWAGGDDAAGKPSCKVEIMDLGTQTASQAFLFHPFHYVVNEGLNTVVKDNKIVWFATLNPLNGNDTDRFNIYNTISKTWFVGLLPVRISGASIIAVNNTIYIAGGYINGKLSDQVWTLEL